MYYQPQQQNPQGGYAANPTNQKKEKTNVWEGVGLVRARSANENDPLRLYDFANGGSSLHFNLKVSEFTGTADQNGNPKVKIVSVPVDVYTNKNVTKEMLGAIVPGMKVRVVGHLDLQSYESKRTGSKVTSLVVKAYVLEILEGPQYQQNPYGAPQGMQAPVYGAPVQQYPPQQGYGPAQHAPAYGMQAPQYPQPQPMQAPGYGAPQYPQPQPYAGPQAQQMPAQGQQMPRQQAPAYQQGIQQPMAPQQPKTPPYYRSAPAPQQPPQNAPITAPRINDNPPEDMPE